MSLSAFVCACTLIATACINCRKEFVCVCTSVYAYFSFPAVVVVERGHQRLRKYKKNRGTGGKAPQKPEHFDARKGNGNHTCDPTYGFINEILTPPPPYGVLFFSGPPKIAQPPQLVNNDRPLNLTFNI